MRRGRIGPKYAGPSVVAVVVVVEHTVLPRVLPLEVTPVTRSQAAPTSPRPSTPAPANDTEAAAVGSAVLEALVGLNGLVAVLAFDAPRQPQPEGGLSRKRALKMQKLKG